MSNFKEIVTKAIIGKCKKKVISSYDIECDEKPNTILGCWVINHSFRGVNNLGKVNVSGSFDVNVWYSYDNDTKTDVLKETVPYTETVHIKNNSNVTNQEAIIRSLKQPNCIKVDIDGNDIVYTIEKELGIELVGDEKVKIAIDENEDPWDEIIDDVNDKQIDNEVDENFIKEDESI